MQRLKGKILSSFLAFTMAVSSFGILGETSASALDPPAPIHSMDDMYSLSYSDTSIQSNPLLYRLYVPANYDASKAYPLLVYLNGAGSRGTNNTTQLNNLAPLINPLIDNADYPCIIAVPQLPTTDKWVNTDWTLGSYSADAIPESNSMKLLMGLLTNLQSTYHVDSNRLYLMGQSFGGYGTWDAIIRHPNLFAAAIPMCGSGDPTKASLIKDMPLLVLHGDADPTVPVSGSRDMTAALQAAGSTTYQYIEYPGDDHYVQRRLFEQPDMWIPWLFAQEKGKTPVPLDTDSLYMQNTYYNLNSSSQLTNWTTPSAGTWSVSGEQLTINASSALTSMAVAKNTSSFTDGQLSAYFTVSADYATGGGGLIFRVSADQKSYVHVRFSAINTVQLLEFVNGTAVKTTTQTYHWIPGRITNIRAVLSGAHVAVYFDNTKVFDQDIQSSVLQQSGSVGLRYYNGTVQADDVVWATKKADPITLTGLADRQVIQRDPVNKNGRVSITGTYDGTAVTSIKAKIVSYDDPTKVIWDTADVTMDSGNASYSYSATVPQGGWYRMIVDAYDSGGQLVTEAKSGRWGVGINILCMGQSNMVGIGMPAPYVEADDRVSNFMNESWSHLVDPYDAGDSSVASDGSYGGSMVPTIGNALVAQYNVPVGFIPAAKGGTSLLGDTNDWSKRTASNPFDRSNLYGNSIYRVRAAGGVEFIVMNQGEHDVSDSVTEDAYLAAFNTLVANYRSDLSGAGLASADIPFIYCQLGPAKASSWGDDRNSFMTGIRNAQFRANNEANHIFLGATEFGLQRNADNLHYTTASQAVIGQRVANTIKYTLGDPGYYMGPVITSAQYATADNKTIDVHIRHNGGTDITPASSITGFEVSDGTGEISITSAVRLDATTIRLTLAAAPTGDASLRYMYGLLPDDSSPVKDNTPLALPLNATVAPVSVAAYQVPAPAKYNVTIGSLQNGTVTADRQAAAENETVSVTIIPNLGYCLKLGSLKANGTVITGNSFAMPAQSITITAEFIADKSNLNDAIAMATAKLPSAEKIGDGVGKYSQLLVDRLTDAISQAQAISNKDNATAAEVSAALANLQNAMDALQPNPLTLHISDSATGISVSADTGVLPADAELSVQVVNSGSNFELASNLLKDVSGKIRLLDISVLSGGVTVQPNGSITVRIPVPQGFDKDKLALFHIADDGTKTQIPFTLDGNTLVFTSTHFSYYTIADTSVPGSSGTSGDNGSTPATGENPRGVVPVVALLFLSALSIAYLVWFRSSHKKQS